MCRICHYPLILKELTKHLPAEADPGKWKEAILRLESTATTVGVSKNEAKDVEKLLEIEKKTEALPVHPASRMTFHSGLTQLHIKAPIALIGRRVVLEGPLKIRKKQIKDGHVYLFK